MRLVGSEGRVTILFTPFDQKIRNKDGSLAVLSLVRLYYFRSLVNLDRDGWPWTVFKAVLCLGQRHVLAPVQLARLGEVVSEGASCTLTGLRLLRLEHRQLGLGPDPLLLCAEQQGLDRHVQVDHLLEAVEWVGVGLTFEELERLDFAFVAQLFTQLRTQVDLHLGIVHGLFELINDVFDAVTLRPGLSFDLHVFLGVLALTTVEVVFDGVLVLDFVTAAAPLEMSKLLQNLCLG